MKFMISFSRFLFYFQYAHRGVKYQGVEISIAAPILLFLKAASLSLAASSKTGYGEWRNGEWDTGKGKRGTGNGEQGTGNL